MQVAALQAEGCPDELIFVDKASGELVFHIFSALAQLERRLIQERTRAGLTAARARGRRGGRPALDPQDPRVQMAKALYKERAHGRRARAVYDSM